MKIVLFISTSSYLRITTKCEIGKHKCMSLKNYSKSITTRFQILSFQFKILMHPLAHSHRGNVQCTRKYKQ